MRTRICERLGIEFPIFAFTHCRDVVVAVSQAGGFGVLGAVGFSPGELEVECKWIDEHIGDKTYGVDIVIPSKYEGMGEMDPEKLEQQLKDMVPAQHREFAAKLLADAGVPDIPPEQRRSELFGWTEATATPQVEIALQHEKVTLIANALGTPPPEVVKQVRDSGRIMAALCGKVHQAKRHKEAGVDLIIAQGYEGGGHTGDIGSIVLWPQIIDAVAPTPVLAAGGIGSGRQMAAAMALGAEGIWTGSLWLTVEEAAAPPAQLDSYLEATSLDTVRSRSYTGKPCRMLRNEWTDAWENPENPSPLGMPLQGMVTAEAIQRVHMYANASQKVAFNPIGQIVGSMNDVVSSRELVLEIVTEYLEATERLNSLAPEI